MKNQGGITTPFKDAVPVPDVKGDWGGKMDDLGEGGRKATPDGLHGHDIASIEGAPAVGAKIPYKPFPGS